MLYGVSKDGRDEAELGTARVSLEAMLDRGADMQATKVNLVGAGDETIGYAVVSISAISQLREIEREVEGGDTSTAARPAASQQSAVRQRRREETDIAARGRVSFGLGVLRLLGRTARKRPDRLRIELDFLGVQVWHASTSMAALARVRCKASRLRDRHRKVNSAVHLHPI